MLRDAVSRLDPRMTGSLVAAASDVSLVVDGDGVIRDAAFGADGLSEEAGETWLGRRWIDTVTVESRPKILRLIEDAEPGAVTRWRQVNHPSVQGGADVPIRYAALRVPDDDRIIVIGRDLRALSALQQRLTDSQQALERDYARLRGAETRYRVLFQLAGEPILIVDAATRRIAEINPAAARSSAGRSSASSGATSSTCSSPRAPAPSRRCSSACASPARPRTSPPASPSGAARRGSPPRSFARRRERASSSA